MPVNDLTMHHADGFRQVISKKFSNGGLNRLTLRQIVRKILTARFYRGL